MSDGRPRGLAANPAYRRLWTAVAISETGDWLLFIALPLYVLHRSGSALDTSLVFLAELAPAVLAGAMGGGLIDRGHPRRLVAALTAAQAVLLLPLLLAGTGRLWPVYAVAAVQAALTAVNAPALQAIVPSLVGGSELPRANALLDSAANVARLAGSPLGGALLPLLGLGGLVALDALSFVAAAALLAGCRPAVSGDSAEPEPGPGAGLAAGALRAAWGAARREPRLLAVVVISFVASVAQGLFLVLFVLFVLRSLHAGDGAVGLLRGVQAIGGVLGGIAVGAWARRLAPGTLAASGLAAFGAVALLTWNSPALTTATGWYAALFIAAGIPGTALVTGLVTTVQRDAPPRLLGRVLSLVGVAQALGQGAGILAAGLLSGAVSLGLLLNAQAGLYLACALLAFATLVRRGQPGAGFAGSVNAPAATRGE